MRKSFSVVSAAFCLSVIATAGMAAGSGASSGSSQSVTGTQLGSPQEASPATGGGQTGQPSPPTKPIRPTLPLLVRRDRHNLTQRILTALSHLVAVAAAKTDGYVRIRRSSRRRRPSWLSRRRGLTSRPTGTRLSWR